MIRILLIILILLPTISNADQGLKISCLNMKSILGKKYEPLKFMTEGICVLEGLTYKSFENKVNELLEINYDEYLDKIQNHSSIITINNTFELLNKAITK